MSVSVVIYAKLMGDEHIAKPGHQDSRKAAALGSKCALDTDSSGEGMSFWVPTASMIPIWGVCTYEN